ncbi:MAG: DUF1579 domain-containing protein [Acidimicrobiia bacterium]|nr:DUF1579 domain-containing protein [Acidimicrobiia bacterium]
MDLGELSGRWRGTWRTWVEPDKLHSESLIDATVEVLFGGKAGLLRYTAELDGHVDGCALIGVTQDESVVDWLDTWHTSGLVMSMRGPKPAGGRIEGTTTYSAGDDDWRWSIEVGLDGDRLVIRHYNEGPEIPRYLGVEALMDRVTD